MGRNICGDRVMRNKILIFVLLLMVLVSSGCVEETEKTTPTTEDLGISYFEFDRIFGVDSRLTDIQKNEEWKKYEGKIVKWKGRVVDINEGMFGGYTVTFKHKPTTLTFDVMVDFDDSMKDKLITIQIGDYVTYTGKLKSKGGTFTTPTLDGIDIES